MPAFTSTRLEFLFSAAAQLADAGHGRKKQIAEQLAACAGCSVQTLYRQIKQAGLGDDERKRRHDAGTSVMTPEQVKAVGGMVLMSNNNKGQHMPISTAVKIMKSNGHLGEVSAATVIRNLKAAQMHPGQMGGPKACVELASLHPNHVWQIDSTTGAYYYLPGGKLRWMPEEEFYLGKVNNIVKASTDLLTRYAATDHTSHAFKVRYYLGGETAENLLDFACWAMWKQDGSPMHGVPAILMMDPGAANKGLAMRNFCRRLGIRLIHHASGAANVTGSVEKLHDIVRAQFETRLRFIDPSQVGLDWLNAEISQWAAMYCSTEKHRRHHGTRHGTWLRIREDQLRVAASLEALRDAATKQPETRRVSNDLKIQVGKHWFDVSTIPGAEPAQKVLVAVNVFRSPSIDVQSVDQDTGEETWHVVDPIQINEYGFSERAVVIGHDVRTARHSQADSLRDETLKDAYGMPSVEDAIKARKRHAQAYAGSIDVLADVKASETPDYMPRRGTPLGAAAAPRVHVPQTLTHVEAAKRLRAALGDAYGPHVYAWLTQRHPAGVPEDQIAAIAAQLGTQAEPSNDSAVVTDGTTGLRIVR